MNSKIIDGSEIPDDMKNILILGGLTRNKESCSEWLDTAREHFSGLEEITYKLLYEAVTCVYSVQSHSTNDFSNIPSTSDFSALFHIQGCSGCSLLDILVSALDVHFNSIHHITSWILYCEKLL